MFRTQDSESFAVDLLLRIVVIAKQISEKKSCTLKFKMNLLKGCFDGLAQV